MEQVETMKMNKKLVGVAHLWGHPATLGPQGPSTSSKCKGPEGLASRVIGSFIGMGMVGFCFGIGLTLAVKTVNNLECCIEEVISRK